MRNYCKTQHVPPLAYTERESVSQSVNKLPLYKMPLMYCSICQFLKPDRLASLLFLREPLMFHATDKQ